MSYSAVNLESGALYEPICVLSAAGRKNWKMVTVGQVRRSQK